MAESQRLVWLDALRLIAGVSMVGLHATADSTGQPFTDYPPQMRIAPLMLRAVIYTARTELFMIIAIFLLLLALERRPLSYRETIIKQARRLLIPFVFWTGFYLLFNQVKASFFGYPQDVWDALKNPKLWADYLLLGDVKYHMHFIPTLFGMLLFYPLFRFAVRQPLLGLGIIVCLVVKREVDVTLWSALWEHPSLPYVIRATKIVSYVGYGMVAGAFLGLWRHHGGAALAAWTGPLVYFGSLLFAIKLIATWHTVESGVWPFDYTPGYWADFLMPVLLFAILLCQSHKSWPPVISRMAPYAFGIYLCHPIFLDLAEIALIGTPLSPIVQVLGKIGFAVTSTTLLVAGLARLPLLAWTIGMGELPFKSTRPVLGTASYSDPQPAKPSTVETP